jgi:hypothetical protein
MTILTLLPVVVQSVCAALTPVLPALVAKLGPECFLNTLDRQLAHSVLEGARQAVEQALSNTPGKAVQDSTVDACTASRYEIHSALGKLTLMRSSIPGRDGKTVPGLLVEACVARGSSVLCYAREGQGLCLCETRRRGPRIACGRIARLRLLRSIERSFRPQ